MHNRYTPKYLKFIFTTLLVLFLNGLEAQEVKKESFLYADSLYADRYYVPTGESGKKPAMIFLFGGGFYTGTRDRSDYLPYFHYLAQNGIEVFSIDYRLGLKPLVESLKEGNDSAPKLNIATAKAAVNLLQKSIDMAVEDLYKATAFILTNAEKWSIDTSLIMVSGSSAGAITLLQAQYYMANLSGIKGILPQGFRYAGAISFAGAILNLHGRMKWETAPAPTMLFHGNADSNVPYNRIWTPFVSFNGSKYIAKKLSKIEAPHYLYTIEEADHSIAIKPMLHNLPQIMGFIEEYIYNKKESITNTVVEQPLAPKVKKRFKIKDYIKSNI